MTTGNTWKTAIFILAVVFVLRLPAFWTPILDVDESQFAGFADWLLAGGKPYIASLDTKPLGIYWFYAAVFRLFGRNNMIAVHIVTALWVGLTSLFCYLTTREIHSPMAGPKHPSTPAARRAGFWAALLYAVFTTTFVPKFISTSIVIVMMLPLTASIYCAVLWERRRRLGYMWLAGLLWGIACLFKYQAGINLVVMGFYLLVARPLIAQSIREFRIREFALFALGGICIAVCFAAYLKSIGVWEEYAFWSIRGSFAYIGAGTELGHFWTKLGIRGGAFVASSLLLWILTLRRAVSLVKGLGGEKRTRSTEYLVLIWFILSFVPVFTGGKFYGHYFIQLLPAMCILGAVPISNFSMHFSWSEAHAFRRIAFVLIIAGLVVPSVGFFAARIKADAIYHATGEENPKEYIPIARYVRENSDDDETIFVWGFATPVYLYSNRLGASRFLWCDWLTGRAPGTDAAKDPDFDSSEFITPGSWKLFFGDMEKNRPVFFIDTSPGNHHDYGKYPIENFPELTEYLQRNYTKETSVAGADIYRRK